MAARSTCSPRAASSPRCGRDHEGSGARPARHGARDRAADASPGASTRSGGLAAQVRGRRRRRPRRRRADAQRRASARDGLASSPRSTTGRPATRTGRACCTCASRCRARPCSSRSTAASSRSCRRRSRHTREIWQAKAVTAVVLDTRTGGILAMAAAPGVPPRATAPATPTEWRLRAITDLYEPGSTFKLVTFMAALQEGVITPDTRFRVPLHRVPRQAHDAHDPGRALPQGRELDGARDPRALLERRHDHDRRQEAGRDGAAEWIEHCSASASARGVDLPGEARACVLPDDKWSGTAHPQHPDRREHRGHAVADGGAVRLDRERRHVDAAAHHGGRRRQADARAGRSGSSCRSTWPRSCAACSPRSSTRAPARWRAVTGYSVAGKTGTTPKFDAKHGTYCDPYCGHCEYQTSFVGFAPAKNPRFVALVMVDEPHARTATRRRSRAAASRRPAFQRIAQGILQELRVQPDRPRELGPSTETPAPVELAALCTEAGVASRVLGATAGVDVVDIAYRSERCGPGSLFCALRGRPRRRPRATRPRRSPTARWPCSSSGSCPARACRRSSATTPAPAWRCWPTRSTGTRAASSTSVGVTGTNGKTTTTMLVAAILDAAERPSG